MFGIRKHSPYLCIRAAIIPLMVPAVCVAERIGTDIHRPNFITRAWNVTYQDILVVYLRHLHIRFSRKTGTYLAPVMGAVPKVLFIPDGGLLRESVKEKTAVLFCHAKHYSAAIGIGKSRIALPKTTGETSVCRFELDFRSLAFIYQSLYPAIYVCCVLCHVIF